MITEDSVRNPQSKTDDESVMITLEGFSNGFLYENNVLNRGWGCLLCRGHDEEYYQGGSERIPFVCRNCQGNGKA